MSDRDFDAELQAIEATIGAARKTIATADARRREVMAEKYGLTPGCVVTANGKRYRFVCVYKSHFDPPWLRVNQELKGGEWSNAERTLYADWKLCP